MATPLDADLQPRGVHHHEHMRDALAQFTDQFSLRVLVEHDAGGRAVDAQLVLDGAGPEAVARAEAAVLFHLELVGQEQADALHARRRVGRAGDDQMADVLGGVVVAPGDEDLLAGEQPAAFAVGFGDRGQGRQVRAGLRLGQAHGAGPFAADQLGQDQALLAFGAVQVEGLDGALGQHGAEAKRHVRRMDHLEDGELHGLAEALAAVVRIGGERVPAALDELAVGVGEAGRGGDRAVLVARALRVPRAVERGQHIGGERAGGLQHRGYRVAVQVRIGAGDQRVVADGREREGKVADGRAEGHGRLSDQIDGSLRPKRPRCPISRGA